MDGLSCERQRCKLTGMPAPRIGKFAPVTLGHVRSQGCRDLLAYCNSARCSHSTIINVGHLPDDTPNQVTRRWHCVCEVRPSWCGCGAELADPRRAALRLIVRAPIRHA
jgi:hypothetical protein